jgi:thiosulfate dehydrogenase
MIHGNAIARAVSGAVGIVLAAAIAAAPAAVAQPAGGAPAASASARSVPMPAGPLGEAIRYGELLVTQTQDYAKPYVGNGLRCTNCHLDRGQMPYAAPFTGLWGVFPEYSARDAAVVTLQTRLNDCFLRSMNGRALPADSKEMVGLLAYVWWLSQGVPTGVDAPGRGFRDIRLPPGAKPDAVAGKALYAQKCAACHGGDGQGLASAGGQYTFPPLWGPQSFNIGAGMARTGTAAAFIQAKMPLGQGGTLTDKEAFDIAAYVTRQPRPDFPSKSADWPKGGKPADAPY